MVGQYEWLKISEALGRAGIAHRLTVDLRRHLDRWKEAVDELPDHFSKQCGPSVQATHSGWHDDITWRTEAVQTLLLDVMAALESLKEDDAGVEDDDEGC